VKWCLTTSSLAESHADAQNETTVSVEVKNQQIQHLRGTLEMLREDIADELGESGATALKKLDHAQNALEKGEAMGEKKPAPSSTVVKRLQQFADSLQNAESAVGKALRAVEGGAGYAKEIAQHYNRIAPWFGLPSVPLQMLGE
jgi:hypothetical protein